VPRRDVSPERRGSTAVNVQNAAAAEKSLGFVLRGRDGK